MINQLVGFDFSDITFALSHYCFREEDAELPGGGAMPLFKAASSKESRSVAAHKVRRFLEKKFHPTNLVPMRF